MRLVHRLTRFKPSSKSIFTDRSEAMLLLWIVFIGYASCWCVMFLKPCERAGLLAVVCVLFCHFPKCVLVHIRIKGEAGAVKLV